MPSFNHTMKSTRNSCLGHKHPCWFLANVGELYCSSCQVEKNSEDLSSAMRTIFTSNSPEEILDILSQPSVEQSFQSIAHTERIEHILVILLSKGGEIFNSYINHIRDTPLLQTPLFLRIRSHTEGSPMCTIYERLNYTTDYVPAIVPIKCYTCFNHMLHRYRVKGIPPSREINRFLQSDAYTALWQGSEQRSTL
jgi:hypothetical protein